MNPFTQSLLRQVDDPRLFDFVTQWDGIEALVIRVYKSKAVPEGVDSEYQDLRSWLLNNYPLWQADLEPYWRQARIDGVPVESDPFLTILATPQASGFTGHWTAMQTLPAARQALNEYLISRIKGN